jgi:hypothetical protein
VRCEQCSVSTRGVALDYRPAMRNFVPVLFVSVSLLSLNPACNEPEPEPNVPGEFGEACVEERRRHARRLQGWLYCYQGYCEERCSMTTAIARPSRGGRTRASPALPDLSATAMASALRRSRPRLNADQR